MKVIHYSPIVYLNRLETRELTHNQADLLDEVTIIGWNSEPNETKYIKLNHLRKNLRVILLPGPGLQIIPNAGPYPWLPYLIPTMKNIGYDLVHLHSHLNIQALQVVRNATKSKRASVVTIHGVTAKINSLVDFGQKSYLRTLGRKILDDVGGIICLTTSDANEVYKVGIDPKKIHVIPNGVNEEFFPYSKETHDKTIVWHGRFVPQKGLHYFVKAAKLIQKQIPDVKFRMLGLGPQHLEIQSIIKEFGLEKNFEFLGQIPWLDVPKAIGSASVYMLPSLREGMPWSVLEAMSCGKPVVAFSIPGVYELVSENVTGHLTNVGDYTTMAKQVISLLEDESKRSLYGRNARKIIEQEYTWKQIARRTINLYKSLV